jgi:DHA2 family multidrug resistance protein
VGPTLGGWITDNYSWRWIFFINLPVGILALWLVARLVEDPPYLAAAKHAGMKVDYIGIALLVLGVGALQVMLDKGQQDDWFASDFIAALAVVATLCLVGLVVWEWLRQDPIIDVRLFRNVNFAAASLMMFMAGVVLFSSLVMLPLFLQTLMGYSATAAGVVLSTSGFVLLLEMPIVGQLTTRVPARYLAAFGWLLLALGMHYTAGHLDLSISPTHAHWLRVVQAGSLGFVFVPITLAAYTGLPPEKSNSISGLLNFMRNLGSSVGTSMVTTLIARRSQVHQVTLSAHATAFNPHFQSALRALARRIPPGTGSGGRARAYAAIYGGIISQAATLAFIDVFALLAVLAALMFALSFALKTNAVGAAPAAVE